MAELTDDHILSKMAQAYLRELEQQFSLKDLIGKTIEDHQRIKYRHFRTPREDDFEDPHTAYSHAPDNLEVIIFSDGTFWNN